MKRIMWMCVLAMCLMLCACKDTEANQAKQWNANVEQVQKFQAKYSALKPVLTERLNEAQSTYDGAKSLHGEARVGKMTEANQRLADIVAPFQAYETAATELDTLMTDKDVMNQPASVVNPALDGAKSAKLKAASLMWTPAANAGQAKDHVAQATQALKTAGDQLKALKPKAAPPPPKGAPPAKPASSPIGKR